MLLRAVSSKRSDALHKLACIAKHKWETFQVFVLPCHVMSGHGFAESGYGGCSVCPEACGTAFLALREATNRSRLSLPAYQPCLTAVQVFINRQAKKVRVP